jgi:hypothetical protein
VAAGRVHFTSKTSAFDERRTDARVCQRIEDFGDVISFQIPDPPY